MQSADVIVVGRGLAGTLLSWFLIDEGFRVVVFSDERPAASHVAAGILHPVTGRRLVKSWMAETFLPFAGQTYGLCEVATGKKFFHATQIRELLREAGEYNAWMSASHQPDLSPFVSPPSNFKDDALQSFPWSACVQGYTLHMKNFLDSMHTLLENKCTVVPENLDLSALRIEAAVEYGSYRAEKIIFCEGVQGMANPYWKNLPWLPSKGEMLTIRCPGLPEAGILNRKVFIMPIGDHRFKVGSTFAWDSMHDNPTEEAREKLVTALQKMLRVPFEVVGQEAGIRPTVKERRPFVGFHPVFRSAGIFNGLGTKGAMSAPWLAHHLVQHLKQHTELLPEIDIRRYASLLA